MPGASSFVVDPGDLHHTEVIDLEPEPLAPGGGSVRLAVEAFGLTANNVTYAVFGDALGYWTSFPAPVGRGAVPAWGFAHVEASEHPDVAVGSRFYGFVPMATHVDVRPTAVTTGGFTDGEPRRAGQAAAYTRFVDPAQDALHRDGEEDLELLLRPLFTTSFLLEDHLAQGAWQGADAVLLTSASSKTAIGVAHLLSRRPDPRPAVVGLTSPANLGFVRDLGCYDRVLPYEEAASLPTGPSALVDVAGNPSVVAALHHRLGDRLTSSTILGDTHWDAGAGVGAGGDPLPGPERRLFFAPDQVERRRAEWGPGGVEARLTEAWRSFTPRAATWFTIVHGNGPDAVRRTWEESLRGEVPPSVAHVLSLRGDDVGHLTG